MLWLFRVLLGTGRKVFADGTVPAALRLTDSTVFASGAVNLVDELAGEPTDGNIPVEQHDRIRSCPPADRWRMRARRGADGRGCRLVA